MTEQVENQADAGDWTEVGAEKQSVEQVETEEAEQREQEETEQTEAESDEIELVIDGEAVSPTADDDVEIPEDAPDWAKNLRTKYKEVARKAKEQEKQLQAAPAQPEPEQEVKPRAMPKLADPDIDYDEDKLTIELERWAQEKVKIEQVAQKRKAQEEEAKAEAQQVYSRYNEKKAEVAKIAPDYQKAEDAVTRSLSIPAQNAILQLANNPAALVLAIGRNATLMKELSELQANPMKLAVRIGELNKSVSLAPKVKPKFAQEPAAKAAPAKPQNAEDAKFSSAFPDGKFK